ncbi:MAG: LssY C-terminal domain-containing protein [Candidatus Omnitrophica bacterium]|nr:LssY C-terminal domain-containing protein [Candidatus Omnitrophota bacterium]
MRISCQIFLVPVLMSLVLSGCAHYRPHFDPHAEYFKRIETQEQQGVRVSVLGLSAEESKETFDVNLQKKGILPLWIKVENNDPDKDYFFVQRGVSENYYSPGEAAYMSRIPPGVRWLDRVLPPSMSVMGWLFAPFDYFFVNPANQKIAAEFEQRAFKDGWIPSGRTQEGFIFVPFELGSKEVHIRLFGSDIQKSGATQRTFDFLIHIPGIKQDYRAKDFQKLYRPDQIIEVRDEQELKKVLESLPGCVTNKKADKNGDPVNLVVIGTLDEALTAFTSAKWDETEIVYLSSIWKMFTSFSFKKRYRYSPVSPLYLYGRCHDIAFQKARDTIHERMHLRLWLSPIRFREDPVWVGSVSRDIGVRWTTKTWNLMTHKIDPHIDESLIYVVSDVIYVARVEKYDFVDGAPVSTPEHPVKNLTDDVYYTKGKRLVMQVSIPRCRDFPSRFGIGTYEDRSRRNTEQSETL